jgi:hypothetical protein
MLIFSYFSFPFFKKSFVYLIHFLFYSRIARAPFAAAMHRNSFIVWNEQRQDEDATWNGRQTTTSACVAGSKNIEDGKRRRRRKIQKT